MRHIQLTGSDNRMDCQALFDDPLNPLPPKCPVCGFPDLDAVPQPYFLVKSRTMSPHEMAPAEVGNFLVRDRVRRVLELLAPGQCRFFPTAFKGTAQETPWHLAVPVNQVGTAEVDPAIRRCGVCGQPRSAHPGSQYTKWLWNRESDHDVVKASTWGSAEDGWDKWVSRDLYMSVRLFGLLKKIKARGLDECTCAKATAPNKQEAAWIQGKLDVLREQGVDLHAAGTLSGDDQQWFREYLKRSAKQAVAALDLKPYEKKMKAKLPQSYKDFITRVGPSSFNNIDEQEGFTAHVLHPRDFDYEMYRAGRLSAADEESNVVDGVMFAQTDHGDCFCFDLRKHRKEYEVFLYLHEMNCFEPYASNFAACIRRFAGNK